MRANEEEDQLRRCDDKDKSQALIKTYATFKNVLRQTANSSARVQVRLPPSRQGGIHDFSDDLAIFPGAQAQLLKKVIGDFYAQ